MNYEPIYLTETTFRKMIRDYVYKRIQYKKRMEWVSQFAPKIVLELEEKPFSQESVGYEMNKIVQIESEKSPRIAQDRVYTARDAHNLARSMWAQKLGTEDCFDFVRRLLNELYELSIK